MSAGSPEFQNLDFLVGRWVSDRFGETVEEIWTRASPAVMMGMFCWTHQDAPRLLEFLTLHDDPSGVTLALRAFAPDRDMPIQQAGRPVVWRLVKSGAGEATFEATEGGHRSRIDYRRERGDRLYASLERVEDGHSRIYPYHFRAASLTQHPLEGGGER